MNLTQTREQEQILLAQKSNNINTLKELSNSVYITVRRSVAKNLSTPSETIDKLCNDPSQNVTYIANKFSKNIKNKREIITTNQCVICDINEIDYINLCKTCEKK